MGGGVMNNGIYSLARLKREALKWPKWLLLLAALVWNTAYGSDRKQNDLLVYLVEGEWASFEAGNDVTVEPFLLVRGGHIRFVWDYCRSEPKRPIKVTPNERRLLTAYCSNKSAHSNENLTALTNFDDHIALSRFALRTQTEESRHGSPGESCWEPPCYGIGKGTVSAASLSKYTLETHVIQKGERTYFLAANDPARLRQITPLLPTDMSLISPLMNSAKEQGALRVDAPCRLMDKECCLNSAPQECRDFANRRAVFNPPQVNGAFYVKNGNSILFIAGIFADSASPVTKENGTIHWSAMEFLLDGKHASYFGDHDYFESPLRRERQPTVVIEVKKCRYVLFQESALLKEWVLYPISGTCEAIMDHKVNEYGG
jgi:hypothetical protein